jgi:hypothetical protein
MPGPLLCSFGHSITRYKITVHIHSLECRTPPPTPFSWFPRDGSLPLSTVTRKALRNALKSPGKTQPGD